MSGQPVRCPLCDTPADAYASYNQYDYYSCPECHGVCMNPSQRLSPDRELAEYLTHQNDIHDPRFQQYVRPLVDLIIQEQLPQNVGLDFGAGFAPVITHMLEDHGYTLNLYDPFFHPDTTTLQHTYDYIVTCEVIEHLYHPRETFLQLCNLLNRGGTLYCRTSIFTEDIDFNRWHYRKEATHVFFYRSQTIHWIAQMVGGLEAEIVSPVLCLFRKCM